MDAVFSELGVTTVGKNTIKREMAAAKEAKAKAETEAEARRAEEAAAKAARRLAEDRELAHKAAEAERIAAEEEEGAQADEAQLEPKVLILEALRALHSCFAALSLLSPS
eukprot:COSAG04_NODE_2449_length_4101_cov_30.628333_3_plen_110_part_00